MNEMKKEIRQALLGDLVPVDGRLVASGKWSTKYRFGFRDGFDNVFFLGVMCRRRWYRPKRTGKQLEAPAIKAMQDMGRMMTLQSDPKLEAVYCSYLLNQPSILTFSQGINGIEVTAYSGRGISGWISIFRTLNRFQKGMSESMERLSEEDELLKRGAQKQEDVEERKRGKQEKLDKKQEKKEFKKAKKEAKRKERWERLSGGLPKNPLRLLGSKSEGQPLEERQPLDAGSVKFTAGDVAKQKVSSLKKINQKSELRKAKADAGGGSSLETRQAEAARLAAEAEAARLAAEEAKARLELARAQMEAEEAKAELARLQAKLAKEQSKSAEKSISENEAAANSGESEGNNTHQSASQKSDNSDHKQVSSSNSRKKKRKKRK